MSKALPLLIFALTHVNQPIWRVVNPMKTRFKLVIAVPPRFVHRASIRWPNQLLLSR